ncbi:MAG: glycosyl transferase [Lachnospiraceae bacterium]|nr:glycosyl transferase [Lachnospiraceae bacterium]
MHGFFDKMSDKTYLSMLYRLFFKFRRKLNLENPQTLTEKLQWLKLYDHRDFYPNMVDKCEVKKIVADRVGAEHVIPTLGVYNSFDEIDFDALPEQFVLKCTHDSGGLYFCKDRSTFDKEEARAFLNRRLESTPFMQSREFAYRDVKPRIIAEPFMPELGNLDSVEYKVTCFNGKVNFITVCTGIAHGRFEDRKNDFFDRDWNFLPFRTVYYENSGIDYKKPENLDEIITFCEKIADGIPYVRVDFYLLDGKIYFGETTFYTWGGFIHFTPEEWDYKLGSMVELPEKHI